MWIPESDGGAGDGLRAAGSTIGAADAISQAQRLVDTPRPAGGYSLAWLIKAQMLGDLPTIAALTIRSRSD